MTTLRLLIDACLTPILPERLAAAFGERIDATHVDHVLPPGTDDATVFALAMVEDRILVTANAEDFLNLARGQPDHPGIGLTIEQNSRARQIDAVTRLVTALRRRAALHQPIRGRVILISRANKVLIRRVP